MAIGMTPRKKGLFGRPFDVPGTPGIGDGIEQTQMGADPAPGLGMRPAPQEQKKPGFFDAGGGSQYLFAGLQDFLQRRMGERPTGVANLMQQQAQQQQSLAEHAAKLRERSLDRADKKWEIDYRAQNDIPTIQRNAEYIRQTQGEDVANEYIRNYGQRPEEPRMVNIPGVGSYFGTMSEIQQMLGGAKPQGQSYDPNEWEDYDGGPTQPASGGF